MLLLYQLKNQAVMPAVTQLDGLLVLHQFIDQLAMKILLGFLEERLRDRSGPEERDAKAPVLALLHLQLAHLPDRLARSMTLSGFQDGKTTLPDSFRQRHGLSPALSYNVSQY